MIQAHGVAHRLTQSLSDRGPWEMTVYTVRVQCTGSEPGYVLKLTDWQYTSDQLTSVLLRGLAQPAAHYACDKHSRVM